MPGPDNMSGELWPKVILSNPAFCKLMLLLLNTQALSRKQFKHM